MRNSLVLLAGGVLFSLGIPQLSAAPTINSIANAATNIPVNAPLAQGSIFVIYGSGLGPEQISIAPTPFQSTNLSGTSVTVIQGTTTFNAPMYYTSASQVAALLPSNTAPGGATFKVTYNGETSNGVGHGTTTSNVGIFTIDSTGQGPGIVTYPDYSLVSAAPGTPCGGPNTACGAANPGDTLILWTTGLGPVDGDDASGVGLGQNMPDIPLKIWLGGVQVPVSYQGRSGCCVGEDQIVFKVPDDVPTGCAVPLVAQIGNGTNTISNTVVMPVAHGSRSCTPTNPAAASVDIEQAVMAGPITYGSVKLSHEREDPNSPGIEDHARFEFAKIADYGPGSKPYFLSWIDDQPAGTCLVSAFPDSLGSPPGGDPTPLDAGSSFTVKGPNGSVPVPGEPGDSHVTLSADGTYLVPGDYTVTGVGGPDIGAFQASITFPAQPTLTSPANATTVTRSAGMTVTWSGASPDTYVTILVDSPTNNGPFLASCTAPGGAGTFTIPPYVLLALPPSPNAGIVLKPANAVVPFTATGLSIGFLATNNDGTGWGFGAGTGSFILK